ncbi:MAG: MATE family efflux transporter [Erysipelotrichaceae bacterium]|nr:MATE family efflux transporter [Erysipelotrichaceae bacterium]
MAKLDLLNGPIYKQILKFFFPIMLGSFFQQLYNTVDAIVVGNYIGKEALGAVGGTSGILINLLINFTVGVAGGATVIIAQSYGARDREGVKNGVRSGIFLGVALGFVLMIIGVCLAPTLLKLLNEPDSVFVYSSVYIRIYLLGLVPVMVYNVGSGILRAVGDSKRPLYFLIVSCFVNIGLDLLLVAKFNLGVIGVAIATILSQCIACLLVLHVLGNKNAVYHFELKDFGFEADVLKRIVIIGLPIGLQSVMYSISNLFIQSQVNIYGADTVAAFTAFGKIDALFWMISGAFGSSLITMAGQCFGANKLDRMKKAVWVTTFMYLIAAIGIGSICYFEGEYLYRLFTKDENVILIGMGMIRLLAPLWCTFTLIEVFSSVVRACGDSLKPMIITALGICVVRILWIIFYPSKTVYETLYCYPITWILTSTIFLIYYLRGNWLKICLEKRKTVIQ